MPVCCFPKNTYFDATQPFSLSIFYYIYFTNSKPGLQEHIQHIIKPLIHTAGRWSISAGVSSPANGSSPIDSPLMQSMQSKESERTSGQTASQLQVQNAESSLPGGYNLQHREPIYCNADCVGWWELTVLASHVHPSVSTMARTLLSGANVVYNGNPIKDLSLGAFLEKFLKKNRNQEIGTVGPRSNLPNRCGWHIRSQVI